MTDDEKYMYRCLQLAKLGLGKVQPNPMVGAVIVHDHHIIGEGYHHQYGQAHAEVNALASVKDASLLANSTLYVSLEPCSHYGKTPPCADAIICHHIPKVVIGTIDYHDKVNGTGVHKLQEAGIEVVQHVCEEKCVDLNKRFFTYYRLHRPYIILKWAQTADGFMDIDRNDRQQVHSYWITNPALKVITHKWRSEEDAILVGYRTMLNDKPKLTNRLYPGKSPQRFVIQRNDEVLSSLPYTILPDNLPEMMEILYNLHIQSIIVEGGKKTLNLFLDNDLWDEARILVGSQIWGKGMAAPAVSIAHTETEMIDSNRIFYVRRHF